MSAEIVHAIGWDTPDSQHFVALDLGRDQISLYQTENDGIAHVSSQETVDVVECFDFASTNHGLVSYAGQKGIIHLCDLSTGPSEPLMDLRPKVQRMCQAVSFNSSGILAAGLERTRNDDSLQLWDILSQQSRTGLEPLLTMFPHESISCVAFLPSRPTTLLCGGHKVLREVDTRTAGVTSAVATKYSQGLSVSSIDDYRFFSYSDSSALALWDRRMMAPLTATGLASREPLLLIPRVFGGAGRRCVRYSPGTADEFGVLHDGGLVRRWNTSLIPSATTSYLSSELQPSSEGPIDSLFVNRVLDIRTDQDKVVGFDYVDSGFVCIRQSGHVFRMAVREPPTGLHFDPFNTFQVESQDLVVADKEVDTPELTSSLGSAHSDSETDSEVSDVEQPDSQDPKRILAHDIQCLMQKRASLGYSLDATRNTQLLRGGPDGLVAAWTWIRHQIPLETPQLDLSFCGVTSIWGGLPEEALKFRTSNPKSTADVHDAVRTVVSRFPNKVFVSADVTKAEPETEAYRQLCLRLAGWDFSPSQLEEKLGELESQGQHEKAAGWAAFHGDVERAVESLAHSRKRHLRLMSTAVAGYLVYKDVPTNNLWREQCRRLASEMSMPYLRAIFAYIADGSWFDVLDDGSLPLTERLGIALRFLSRTDLARYLTRLTTRAIDHGDLEGIILTGLTPALPALLQSFLDRSGDIQSVSLLASFGWPRFFEDERVPQWTAEYRRILNSWRFFAQRARFDVGASHLAKSRVRSVEGPIPPQVFLRCYNCKTPIGSSPSGKKRFVSQTQCPNCGQPLPRCAVCLLSLGPSLDDHSHSDRWPTFCLSCNHACHSVHARQWFAKYDVCPVPSCQCHCGKM